ncbi:hypothetical protein ACQKO7_00385 [Pseudomonas putida]|uniref:hypothetical protein n=1 Tax=Pseudomonas putida TaxID=303 RepID=UPI003D0745A9
MQLIINESRILSFPTLMEAEEFIVGEREKWKWLSKLPDQLQKAAKELQKLLIDTPTVNALRGQQYNPGDPLDTVYIGTTEIPYIIEDSEEGTFIQDVLKNYDYVVAYFCVLHCNDKMRALAINNSTLSETLRMGKYEYEKVTAITLSLSLGNYNTFTATRYQSEFTEVLEQQRTDQNEFKARSDEVLKHHTKLVNDQLHTIHFASHKTHSLVQRRVKALKKLSSRGAAAASTAVANSNAEYRSAIDRLAAAASAYTEQLDLKHSVNYWKSRRTSHTVAKYGWLFGVIFSLALMLGSVALYFAHGGLTGISTKLYSATGTALTTSDPADRPSSEQNQKPQSPQLKHLERDTQAQASSASHSNESISAILTKSEITSLATNLTGAILLITLVSIIIKIALRQFSIHTQYALEAGERITFIKTYLALMQEKQIKSDEDRKLILECIFKPTFGTSTPEIAFSLPIDAIMKALGDRKP